MPTRLSTKLRQREFSKCDRFKIIFMTNVVMIETNFIFKPFFYFYNLCSNVRVYEGTTITTHVDTIS